MQSFNDIPPPPPFAATDNKNTPLLNKTKPNKIEEKPEIAFNEKWLAYIGIAALLIGFGLLLKYAFDQNWITPVFRIGIGFIISGALIATGQRLSKTIKRIGNILVGGGAALLYLNCYAAYGFYNLINIPVAFILLTLVSIFTLWLAALNEAQAIAVIGSIGAFISPLLLQHTNSPAALLLLYLAIVILGLHFLALQKKWGALTVVSLIGTIFVFGQWHDTVYKPIAQFFWLGGTFNLLYYFLFIGLAITFIFEYPLHKDSRGMSVLIFAVTALHFAAMLSFIYDVYPNWDGVYTFALALVLALLAMYPDRKIKNEHLLALTLARLSMILIIIAIPLQFDMQWITIGWALAGALIFSVGISESSFEIRIWGLAVLTISVCRLLFIDFTNSHFTHFLLNERTLAYLVVIGCLTISSWMYRYYQPKTDNHLFNESTIKKVLELAAHSLMLIFLFTELNAYFRDVLHVSDYQGTNTLVSARDYFVSLTYALYGIVLIVCDLMYHKRHLRIYASILFGIAILKVFTYDALSLSQGYRIASFLSLGVILLLVAYFYNKYKLQITSYLLSQKTINNDNT